MSNENSTTPLVTMGTPVVPTPQSRPYRDLTEEEREDIRQRKRKVAQRRVKVAALYVKGWSHSKIAKHVGVSTQTVGKDIGKLMEAWKQQAVRDVEERKAEELAKINHLEEKAWEAWERSCQPHTVNKRRVEEVPLDDQDVDLELSYDDDDGVNEEVVESRPNPSQAVKSKDTKASKEDEEDGWWSSDEAKMVVGQSRRPSSDPPTNQSNKKSQPTNPTRPTIFPSEKVSGGGSKDKRKKKRRSPPPKATTVKVIPSKIVTEEQHTSTTGDPRFMDRIAWCIETRMRILGMLKDVKQSSTVITINWDQLAIASTNSRQHLEVSHSGSNSDPMLIESEPVDLIEQKIRDIQPRTPPVPSMTIEETHPQGIITLKE